MIWKNQIRDLFRTNRVGSSNIPCWFVAMVFVMLSGSATAQRFIIDRQGAESVDGLNPPPVMLLPRTQFLPANFLKFYLIFPEKMERGVAFEHLSLLKELKHQKTEPVLEPFREVELWDESGTRLTLWLHPGRQKPGVNLNVEFGPILEAGEIYQLVVSNEWKTERGTNLGMDSTFHVRAIKPNYKQPRPSKWELDVSQKGVRITPFWSKEPRIVDELDPISFAKRLSVRNEAGKDVPVVADGSHLTVLRPNGKPFSPGKYQLMVDPKLEDLAGNSVARPFNVDLEKEPDFQERTAPVILDFEVK